MSPVAYLNGEIIPLAEAKVGILDLGLLRGFGVYEGITALRGEPFHFHDHWLRFNRSAKTLALRMPVSEEEFLAGLRAIIAHNAGKGRASIRAVLTGGTAIGGIEYAPGTETLFAMAEPAVPLPSELYEHGASLITHEHRRHLPHIKTIDYIEAVTLQPRRKDAGALEILYTHDGHVLECATSNVFLVKEGVLITPKEDVLGGITRKVVLDLARSAGIPVEEREVSSEELLGADEVFITSSFKDIVPIAFIDGRTIAGNAPGALTRRLMQEFTDYTQ